MIDTSSETMISKARRSGKSAYSPLDMRRADTPVPRLKVWWIPQVPMKPFEVLLDSFVAAKVLLESLANYDLFQLEQRIKPDYCNTGGLCIWDDGLDADGDGSKWTDWESEEGDTFDDVTLEQCYEMDSKEAA